MPHQSQLELVVECVLIDKNVDCVWIWWVGFDVWYDFGYDFVCHRLCYIACNPKKDWCFLKNMLIFFLFFFAWDMYLYVLKVFVLKLDGLMLILDIFSIVFCVFYFTWYFCKCKAIVWFCYKNV